MSYLHVKNKIHEYINLNFSQSGKTLPPHLGELCKSCFVGPPYV